MLCAFASFLIHLLVEALQKEVKFGKAQELTTDHVARYCHLNAVCGVLEPLLDVLAERHERWYE